MHSWIDNRLIKILLNAKIIVLFILVFLVINLAGQYTFIKFKISNSHPSNFKVYWKSQSSGRLSENNSASVYVNHRKNNHWLILPVRLSEITALRLDPTNREGIKTSIQSIHIFSLSSQPVVVNTKKAFSKLLVNEQITELAISEEQIQFISKGNDPNFLLEFSTSDSYKLLLIRIFISVLLCTIILFLFRQKTIISTELNFVPYCMLLIAILIITMATISRENSHPDEVTHINNARYYATHATPAIACSPETLYTYTTYGVSRLDNREISYYLSGQYLRLLSAIELPEVLKLRALNVIFFLVLTFLTFKYNRFRFISLPILLTPQAWYIFSYFNSDALSLFVIFLTSFQLFIKDSLFRKLLRKQQIEPAKLKLILLGLLVAMQFWVKLNFFFYAMFLGMLLCSWVVAYKSIPKIKPTLSLILVLFCGIALFSSWELWRHSVNDFQLAEKSLQCRELTAGPLYKPSTPLAQTHATFRLRDKGVTLLEIIETHNWFQRILYTGLGAYGYIEYMSDLLHYQIVSFFIIVFVIYLILLVLIKGNNFGRLALASGFIAMFGLIFAVALNNWQQDLQPQGRYLLVFLPIIGSLIALNKNKFNLDLLFLFAIFPFFMAFLSFLFVGLIEIPKI